MLGFKEFTEYLRLSPQERTSEEGKRLFKQGPGPSVPPVYSVDSTDLSTWDQSVAQAIEVVQAYTQGQLPSLSPEPSQRKVDSTVVRQVCDVCGGRVFLHQHEWTGHLKSKKHRHNVKQLAREREKLSLTLSAREGQLREETSSPLQSSHDRDHNEDSQTEITDTGDGGLAHTAGSRAI
ncbi:tRNA dimethylallyltransferase, mitochondrial [Elysia marginata]|uniref:tRNA dimethylallyltransferase, mitochondrial n=1 Tax=Elysia marginata TaxID=1093978 RepID=A0AAV4GYT1_9GAST|nr:tRNA dimethylallyltransferase, mitochondrial [Elysia marginata]